jgi:hypothetical protein
MKRPIGLVLSAIVLTLAALFLLLSSALMAFAGLFAQNQPTISAAPHVALFLMLAISIFYAALAVWAILTVIGILRLRPWARYSILIIGGGLAAIGVFGAVGTLLSRSMIPNIHAQQPTASDPHIASIVLAVILGINLLIATVGTWWLVYFTLPSVRAIFSSPDLLLQPSSPAGRFTRTPTAIKVIAVLMLLGSLSSLVCVLLPFRAFIFGFILPLTATRILYLGLAILSGFAGYGLLRLQESARLLTIGFLILGFSNLILLALPQYQVRAAQYSAQVASSFIGQPQVPFTSYATLYLVSSIFGIVFYGVIFWFLHRHRAAFQTPPTDPILPA